jgi:hypothetical protein
MTAINPARLKIQTAELGELIGLPDQFTAQLHELLSLYSTRVRQTNLSRTPLTLQTYQTPEPVILALESEIEERLAEDPEAGYSLVDALWKEFWVEFRQLAVYLNGILPIQEPDRILTRIQAWLECCTSEDIRRLIMTEGMANLAREETQLSLKFIEELIRSESKENLQAAIFGLELYVKDPSYPNLPLLFKYLSNILLIEETGLTKEISALLRILASRSEQETAYFLAKQLGVVPKSRILRVIRAVIGNLSQENQELLREKMEIFKN